MTAEEAPFARYMGCKLKCFRLAVRAVIVGKKNPSEVTFEVEFVGVVDKLKPYSCYAHSFEVEIETEQLEAATAFLEDEMVSLDLAN